MCSNCCKKKKQQKYTRLILYYYIIYYLYFIPFEFENRCTEIGRTDVNRKNTAITQVVAMF